MNSKKSNLKIINAVLSLLGLTLVFVLTDLFLKSNFQYNGEAYFKGAGHILQENLIDGLIFLSTRHLFVSTIIFYLLFYSIDNHKVESIYKILKIAWICIASLTLIYAGIKIYDVIDYGYDRIDRIIEITFTWILRVVGFFLGHWIAIKISKLGKEEK